MNYAFYISGKAGRLRELININSNVLSYTRLVITDSEENSDLKDILAKMNIKFFEIKYVRSKKNMNLILSEFLLKNFQEFDVDYCFSFGDHILKGELLEIYKNKIINFHPSLLPLYPGRKAIDKAMKDDSSILLGNTAHFIDDGVDTGPVILQTVVSKSYFENNDYAKILNLQLDMLEFIHDNLIEESIKIFDRKVFVSSDKAQSPSFHFNDK